MGICHCWKNNALVTFANISAVHWNFQTELYVYTWSIKCPEKERRNPGPWGNYVEVTTFCDF